MFKAGEDKDKISKGIASVISWFDTITDRTNNNVIFIPLMILHKTFRKKIGFSFMVFICTLSLSIPLVHLKIY